MTAPQTTPELPLLDKVLVTCYPARTVKQFQHMRKRVAQKPYAKYFHEDLHIYSDIVPAIKNPLTSEQVLPLKDISRLLEPAYFEEEEGKNGWCALSDGTAYVASKTRFPGVTGDMIDWWFWWHSVEPERYALWYPYNHVEVQSSFAAVGDGRLHRADLCHREKWLGSTHRITEFIGPHHKTVRIQFVEPDHRHLNLASWSELQKAGYAAAVCAVLWDGSLPLKLGEFVHLWRTVEGGLELHSRYWLGHEVHLQLLGLKIPLDCLGGLLGIKRRLAGEEIAYEQFLHDQIEFTNLAGILPGLYSEYGPGRLP
ncbi:phloretin hydrolase [Apiospora kogelbergensis]|uniref:Phloretin hydrolase n=1 Tax=Apiospora kogelbergensis TaxID=1337665 RepID=A0AAW0QEW8_9PEZI